MAGPTQPDLNQNQLHKTLIWNTIKGRVHSEMKISLIKKSILVIVPISSISFRLFYLSERKGYGKIMQVQKQGCKNMLSFLTPDIAILNLPNTFLQYFRD